MKQRDAHQACTQRGPRHQLAVSLRRLACAAGFLVGK